MSMEIGRSEDGSSHFGLGLKSEGTENGVAVKTDLSAIVDGQRCPTAEGQVSFSIKAKIGSESGGVGTTRDLTTFVRAVVNDDAEISSSTFDVIQGTTQVKGDRQVYIETGATFKFGEAFSDGTASNWRVNQKTDNVTQADLDNLESAGFKAALELGVTSLVSAKYAWQNGGCVKIEAASPGTVKPNSKTQIAVTVMQKFDGSVVSSKLDAVLAGETSIDPASLPKTPGTLTYTAPGDNGKSATIKLKATSRCGIAVLDLTATTGGQSFTFAGENNGAYFSGTICSPDKSFEMKVDASGYSWIQTFTPNSPTGGHMEGSYKADECTLGGEGPYTITLNEDGTGTLNWTINSTVTCTGLGSSQKTINHQLPLQPAPEGTCPG